LPDYTVTSHTVEYSDELESAWFDLQQRSDCSYFQSWGWISAWLETISFDLRPVAVKIWHEADLVGFGLFVSRDIKRHIIIYSKAMFLNEYPFDGKNMVIEYNGLLAARGHEAAVYTETLNYMLRVYRDYDEFYFGAIEDDSAIDNLLKPSFQGINSIVNEKSTSWSIDLNSISPDVTGFLSSLSKNRQGQIRRSIRLYELQAPVQIIEANNKEEAQIFFDRLKVLHTKRWQSKGKQGVFANPLWERFHLTLIHGCFDKGEVQLLKIYNDYNEIGYLYNFIWRKHVYVLQTGFMQAEDKRLMPGYVTHAYAVAYNKAKGMEIYDLMHGDDLYKRIL